VVLKRPKIWPWVALLVVGHGLPATAGIFTAGSPPEPTLLWSWAHRLVQASQAPVRANLSFVGFDAERLVFHLEIQNLGFAPLEVRPSRFYYTVKRTPAVARRRVYAIDPDRRLTQLHNRLAETEAAYDRADLQDLIYETLYPRAPELVRLGEALHLQAERLERERRYRSRIRKLRHRQASWQTALRRVTLLPGRKTAGRLYFPYPAGSTVRFIRIFLPLGNRVLTFRFDVRRHTLHVHPTR